MCFQYKNSPAEFTQVAAEAQEELSEDESKYVTGESSFSGAVNIDY